MEDADLIVRCQAGDLAAFEALFERYARRVLQTAYLITGDRQTAEDVMQEAFIQTFRAIGQLREPLAFGSWLYRTTIRLAGRAAERARAERLVTIRLAVLRPAGEGGPGGGGSAGADGASFPTDEAERRQALWEAIQQLPEQQRTAVVLHYFEDRPVGEIAALMEVAEGTVKSWLHRARAALARLLGEPADDAAGGAGGKAGRAEAGGSGGGRAGGDAEWTSGSARR